MKTIPFLLCFLPVLSAAAQDLTFAVDGANRSVRDSIGLSMEELMIERVIVYRSLQVYPRKTTTSTFHLVSPMPLKLGETEFLACPGDSIHISYNTQTKKYEIDGGRYPGNYRLYPIVTATRYPRELYRSRDDNYDEYVRAVDSISGQVLSMIRQELARGNVSPDAADYLSAYIKYDHLGELLSLQSPIARTMRPNTRSSLFPTANPEDFRHDSYAWMFSYILCTQVYIRNQRPADPSPGRQRAGEIAYAIDSLSGATRERILYTMIVPGGYKGPEDRAAMIALFSRIRSLHLPAWYAAAIDRQYRKRMLQEEPLTQSLLSQALLKTPAGRNVSLQSILSTSDKDKIFLKFRECGGDEQLSGWMQGEPASPEKPVIIYVYLDRSFQHWQKCFRQKDPKARIYYLTGGFENPLASYLLIDRLPVWVALNKAGRIENIDLSLDDMFRYNLANLDQ